MTLAPHRTLALGSTIVLLTMAGAFAPGCKAKKAVDDNKLVIVKAAWGDLRNEQTADVTPIVAGMVKDNALSVEASAGVLGEPANLKVKHLRVEWSKGGVVAKRRVMERETLTIRADEKPMPTRLVVRKAIYGNVATGKTADVTKIVAEMVSDNTLSVTPSNGLFGDPASFQTKHLHLDYTLDGVAKSKVAGENEQLRLPETAP
jgi:hypothetical protein